MQTEDLVSQRLGQLRIPTVVKQTLVDVAVGLEKRAGKGLHLLAVYGGVARGRFVAGRSDVNLFVMLARVDTALLGSIAEPLRDAWRALRVEPVIVSTAEFERVAALFPIKFLDIQRRHIVLVGSERALMAANISLVHARLRIEQELRNMAMRLRRRYVQVATDDAMQFVALARIAQPLAIELSALLSVDGVELPTDDRTQTILGLAASRYGLDASSLAVLAQLRQGETHAGDATQLTNSILAVLDRCSELARGPA